MKRHHRTYTLEIAHCRNTANFLSALRASHVTRAPGLHRYRFPTCHDALAYLLPPQLVVSRVVRSSSSCVTCHTTHRSGANAVLLWRRYCVTLHTGYGAATQLRRHTLFSAVFWKKVFVVCFLFVRVRVPLSLSCAYVRVCVSATYAVSYVLRHTKSFVS